MDFIVDVGCSWNATRTLPIREKFNLPLMLIEPDIDSLRQVPVRDGDIMVNAAISSLDGETSFHFYGDGTHSILEANVDQIHMYIDGHTGAPGRIRDWLPRQTAIVPCFRLATLFDKYSVDNVPFLKIDAQGHDLEVLKSAGEYMDSVWIFEVEVQITEFEVYLGQSRLDDVREFASGHGFELVASHPQTYDQELNLTFRNRRIGDDQKAWALAEGILKQLDALNNAALRSQISRTSWKRWLSLARHQVRGTN